LRKRAEKRKRGGEREGRGKETDPGSEKKKQKEVAIDGELKICNSHTHTCT